MNHKARATIEQYGMLKRGDLVTAAVSGGADSVALLDFLCSLTDLEIRVRACHLNHCLRGEESDRDEQLVRTMCREYGVPLEVRRVEVKPFARAQGLSIETAARRVRYAFFEELAAASGCKIATAHTLSDATETVLLNLTRGTGIAGLCGIPPVRGAIIRPLIACTRQEIERYCYDHALWYVTDSTNLCDDYTRNYIRHNVLPQLFRVNPGALEAVGRMTEALREDADYLTAAAGRAAQTLAREGGVDAAALWALHPALRSRVVAGLLEECGVERSSQRIAAVEELLSGGRRHLLQLSGSWYAAVRDGILRMERRNRSPADPIPAMEFAKTSMDGLRLALTAGKTIEISVINCADYEIFENNERLHLKNAADYDKINNDVFLRSRQAGDTIKPAGRGCTKTLKKLFSELALPDREHLCVLADTGGVFYAEEVGVDERVRVDKTTKRMMTVTVWGEPDRDKKDAEGKSCKTTY